MRRHSLTRVNFGKNGIKYYHCFSLVLMLILFFVVSAAGAASVDSYDETADETTFKNNRAIEITTDKVSVNVGRQIKLVAEITRLTEDAPLNSQVEWISENEDIAKVSQNGDLRGINPGTVQIICRLKDDPDINSSVNVTVNQPVKSIKLDSNKIELQFGASEAAARGKLSVTVEPQDATVKECAYSSSNEDVVTVDAEGRLQAIGPGNARITVVSLEEGSNVKAYCNISVGQAITSISLPATQLVNKKQAVSLKPGILPETATQKKLEYATSDPSVAVVAPNGTVTGVECGTAIVTAKATDGSEVFAECKITVIQMVRSIRLDKTNLNMQYNTTYNLQATVIPEDATNPALVWSSSDQSIVTVSSRGELNAKGIGNAIITCSSVDGSEVKAKVEVRVTYTSKTKGTLSDGYPIAEPYEMRYKVQNELQSGNVEVHYLKVQKLNNNYLRFSFSYNAPAGYGISAFSPPNGQFYKVIPKRNTSAGEDYVQFEIYEDDFLNSSHFTMKFYSRNKNQFWVFPTIDSDLKLYVKDPAKYFASKATATPSPTPKPTNTPSPTPAPTPTPTPESSALEQSELLQWMRVFIPEIMIENYNNAISPVFRALLGDEALVKQAETISKVYYLGIDNGTIVYANKDKSIFFYFGTDDKYKVADSVNCYTSLKEDNELKNLPQIAFAYAVAQFDSTCPFESYGGWINEANDGDITEWPHFDAICKAESNEFFSITISRKSTK